MPASTLKFKLRTSGTGAVIGSAVQLSVDDTTALPASWKQEPDPVLTRIACSVLYFSGLTVEEPYTAAEARRRVVRRLEELRFLCRWRGSPTVRVLGRGKALVPNVFENFGDLVLTSLTGDSLILDNCCLFDSGIEDDVGVEGIGLRLVFARACDTMKL